MVTTVYMQGTTTEKVRIGDGAAGAGDYEIYLNPKMTVRNLKFPMIAEVSTLVDTNFATSGGQNGLIITFQECTMLVGIAAGNGEKFWRALLHWSANDDLLYLNDKDEAGYDRAVFGAIDDKTTTPYTVTGVAAIRCRVLGVSNIVSGDKHYKFNLTVKRYTS